MPRFRLDRVAAAATLALWTLIAGPAAADIPVVFDFQDSAGEGFFDNTPLSDPDVPGATTVGEARRTVLEAAGTHLGSFFEPQYAGETWRIGAVFDPFASGEGIAGAGPSVFRNGATFAGGTSGVNYPASLINHLAGSTVIGGNIIEAEFNSNFDFDYDQTGPPSTFEESLFSTAVHELFHGLGFFSDIESNGTFFDGIPTIFDTFLSAGGVAVGSMSNSGRSSALRSNDLFFTGPLASAANPLGTGDVQIHAPSSFEPGSTGSHLDRVAFAGVGDLMLPEASSQVPEQIFLSSLDIALAADLGYSLVVPQLEADFDGSGIVDGSDLTDATLGWEARFGNDLDGGDFLVWQRQFGSSGQFAVVRSIPEPTTIFLAALAFALKLSPRPASPSRV